MPKQYLPLEYVLCLDGHPDPKMTQVCNRRRRRKVVWAEPIKHPGVAAPKG